jgi:hypothetical protein
VGNLPEAAPRHVSIANGNEQGGRLSDRTVVLIVKRRASAAKLYLSSGHS